MTLEAMLRARLGRLFRDRRNLLPDVPSRYDGYKFGHRDLDSVQWLAIHHTAGPSTQTAKQIYDFHVRERGWSGIGYHFLVYPDGVVVYVGDVATSRANVANMNDAVIGVCFPGDYRYWRPTGAAVKSGRVVVATLREYLGRSVALARHGDLNQTECPGSWDISVLE